MLTPEFIGKQVLTAHRLILDSYERRRIIPAQWHGEIVNALDNGLGEILLKICWQETGQEDWVRENEVEVCA